MAAHLVNSLELTVDVAAKRVRLSGILVCDPMPLSMVESLLYLVMTSPDGVREYRITPKVPTDG